MKTLTPRKFQPQTYETETPENDGESQFQLPKEMFQGPIDDSYQTLVGDGNTVDCTQPQCLAELLEAKIMVVQALLRRNRCRRYSRQAKSSSRFLSLKF